MVLPKEKIIAILKENASRLKKTYHLKELYLFGSVSRGELANDVDIMIEDEESFTLYTKMHLSDDLENLFNSKVDIVCKDGLSKEFYATIEDDLIAI